MSASLAATGCGGGHGPSLIIIVGTVSATCRYYGISRTCYYKWLKRYEDEGFEGLKDRSSAPHNSPKATNAEVVEKILWLRP